MTEPDDFGTLADPYAGGRPASKPSAVPKLGDVLAVQTRRTKTVRVCVDGELVDRLEVLNAEMDELHKAGDDDAALVLAEGIETLSATAVARTFAFRMISLSPADWSDLMAAHEPRKGKTEAFNQVTFPMAAVGSCCIEPVGIDEATIGELWDRLSVGDRGRLFGCAWEANVEATDIPNSSAASALLRIYGRSSTTADHAASPGPSSLGE